MRKIIIVTTFLLLMLVCVTINYQSRLENYPNLSGETIEELVQNEFELVLVSRKKISQYDEIHFLKDKNDEIYLGIATMSNFNLLNKKMPLILERYIKAKYQKKDIVIHSKQLGMYNKEINGLLYFGYTTRKMTSIRVDGKPIDTKLFY